MSKREDKTLKGDNNKVVAQPRAATLKDMLCRLQKLPKPAAVEERDTEPLPERPGL